MPPFSKLNLLSFKRQLSLGDRIKNRAGSFRFSPKLRNEKNRVKREVKQKHMVLGLERCAAVGPGDERLGHRNCVCRKSRCRCPNRI